MCGLTGIVTVKNPDPGPSSAEADIRALAERVDRMAERGYAYCGKSGHCLEDGYLGGADSIEELWRDVRGLKREQALFAINGDPGRRARLAELSGRVAGVVDRESRRLSERMGLLTAREVEEMSRHIDRLRDVAWCIDREILENLDKIAALRDGAAAGSPLSPHALRLYKNINAVFNSIDRLEVRGRDSAGVSLLFRLARRDYKILEGRLREAGLWEEFQERCNKDVLVNRGIAVAERSDAAAVSVSMVYKVAAEIGALGDNIAFLRRQVAEDRALQLLSEIEPLSCGISSHTRWASVGAISEPNCHPVDNRFRNGGNGGVHPGGIHHDGIHPSGVRPDGVHPDGLHHDCVHPDGAGAIIHVCLNGDIDNYLELKREAMDGGAAIPDEITTDTKIIPMRVDGYLRRGHELEEAFRLAVNDFDGSHAIAMHTDLAPGKLFLAQRGSGQAIFVGLAEDHYICASEVYGFVEETPRYIKLEGAKVREGKNGPVSGQIVVLDGASAGGLAGIRTFCYDGAPIPLSEDQVQLTAITSRDIDRQGFDHYFLKEISESPVSVEKTLFNRWKLSPGAEGDRQYVVELDDTVVPPSVAAGFGGHARVDTGRVDTRSIDTGSVDTGLDGAGPDGPAPANDGINRRGEPIRRIFFVGQGTAGVAAQACADILDHYMDDPALRITSLKASELSGFKLGSGSEADATAMSDALVIAISQSGTTTDTNRAVDMVKARGARTLAIVNRRDSDITFKVDGVMYTSSGRDIEMSVASTKAFYSQIVAGALLGLYLSNLAGRRDAAFVAREMKQLLALPDKMRRILGMRGQIAECARRLAIRRTYWAAVGSGPNKTSADEIRIKLSELCYKTISSDYVEDKKHIDLSSEPLIIVCAAGTRPTVIGDLIKDTAIFMAHKALPIVIADEGERRFDPYAEQVFHVPAVDEHLAPVLNTLVGHIWGYYAALAINEGSRFLFEFREAIQGQLGESLREGRDLYEMILDRAFRERVALFYAEFRKRKTDGRLPSIIGFDVASDLTLLLKYLAGRLPMADFELDFGVKGTAANMLDTLMACLGRGINHLARPVDAIKHQAKTVTVGTSRMAEKTEGRLFDALGENGFLPSRLTPVNVMVLRNLQAVVGEIRGSTAYKVAGLDLLGEPTDRATIQVTAKTGTSAAIHSRVEADNRLKGTKRIIVSQGNVYIGKGRADNRPILIIPVLSESPETPNIISNLLLLDIGFRRDVDLSDRVRALGGKYEHIKNIVQENSVTWRDEFLEWVDIDELFGRSAEKIGERIVGKVKQ